MVTTTVTGLTAARMLTIEAASIVDGDVVGDNLILTRHDGGTIDAGSVRGDTGATGPAGDVIPVFSNAAARDSALPSPTAGMACILTSTGQFQVYQSSSVAGTAGWYPPWDTSWGEITKRESTGSPNVSTVEETILDDSVISAIDWPKNRILRVEFHCGNVQQNVSPGAVKIKLKCNASDIGMFGQATLSAGNKWSVNAALRVLTASTLSSFPISVNAGSDFQFEVSAFTSAGNADFNASSSSDPGPIIFRVVDEGPS